MLNDQPFKSGSIVMLPPIKENQLIKEDSHTVEDSRDKDLQESSMATQRIIYG